MTLRAGSKGASHGFCRADLLALISILFLGAAVANPLFLSHSRARSETLVCQANLGQIGRAFQLWASDHEERYPFLVPSNEGGLWRHPLALNLYMQFACVSNELSTPKVLVCPADTNTTRRAKDFSRRPDGGFMNATYQNNAVGYFVGFHAERYRPRSILSGDRNLEGISASSCSVAAGTVWSVAAPHSGSGSSWGQQIHFQQGNLLFNDGSAEETSTARLRAVVAGNVADDVQAAVHVGLPKQP